MLWYKFWVESRVRFLASLCAITVITAFFVQHGEGLARAGLADANYSNAVVFFANQYLVGMWILCVILLGMGGLVREKAVGTASFTLALPISRTQITAVRIVVGLFESVTLAVVPWLTILLITDRARRPVLFSQAAYYLLLLISGGLIYFSVAVLVSSLIQGESTAAMVAYAVTIVTGIVFGNVEFLRRFLDIWRFVGGDNRINRTTFVLQRPVPWVGVLVSVCIVALILFASLRVVERSEF